MQHGKKQQNVAERWRVSREEFLDIRMKLRLSQGKLATLMGVSRDTIMRLEHGTLVVPKWASLAIGYIEEHYSPQVGARVRIHGNLKEAHDEKQFGPAIVAPRRAPDTDVDGLDPSA
jgi:DNA-binding XRE family transcriptional regulator